MLAILFLASSCGSNQEQNSRSSNSFKVYEFSLQDLDSLLNANTSEFETFVLDKGYSLKTNEETSSLKQIYRCDFTNSDEKKPFISREVLSNNKYIIAFTNTAKQHYLNFKNSLEKDGYVFVSARDNKQDPPTTQLFYSNKKNTATLFTQTDSDGLVWYTITLGNLDVGPLLKSQN